MSTSADEYRRRGQARSYEAARQRQRSNAMGNLRLGVFLAGALCAWLSFSRHLFSPWWLLAFVAAFIALVVLHDAIIARQHCAEKASAVYQRGLARIEDRWTGTGATGERFRVPDHIFADDLDLFGRGSLFQLLSAARTPLGEETLASWLLHPAELAAIRERQHAIAELRDNLDLREDLATLGSDVAVPHDVSRLLAWADGEVPRRVPTLRVLAGALMLLAIAAAVFGLARGVWTPLLLTVALEGGIAWRLRKRIEEAVEPVSGAAADLGLVATLLERVEREPFTAPRLRAVAGGLKHGSDNRAASSSNEEPARAMARLRMLSNLADSRHHMLLRFLDIPLMYSLQVAFAVNAWRRRHGASVRHWLEALAEIEALVSLAAYSYEHPDDPFPEFADSAAPLFVGEELGHPLLPAAQCVRNSIALGAALPGRATPAPAADSATPVQVLLVSGSNMSGKSTFLRTAGINAVLAMAGAPIRGRALRLTPLRLGTAIRVTDSLQAGRSGFYAEITRLRHIMDLTYTDLPVLFLLDELLHGTNSHDRRIGAEALVRALIERGAIGVVTTHDLALTAIGTAALDGRVSNAHFEDELRDGRMIFDYRLHDGVVTHSNALELMRSVGLDV